MPILFLVFIGIMDKLRIVGNYLNKIHTIIVWLQSTNIFLFLF